MFRILITVVILMAYTYSAYLLIAMATETNPAS